MMYHNVRPELDLFPDLAETCRHMRFERRTRGIFGFPTVLFERYAQRGVFERQDLRGLGRLGRLIVTLARKTHGKNIVAEPVGLRPCRREVEAELDFVFAFERFDPAETVRIDPNGVVHTRDPYRQFFGYLQPFGVPFFTPLVVEQQVRQQETHLVCTERIFGRPCQFVPDIDARRTLARYGSGIPFAVDGYDMPVVHTRTADIAAQRAAQRKRQEARSGVHPSAAVSDRTRTPEESRDAIARIDKKLEKFVEFVLEPFKLTLFDDELFRIGCVEFLEQLDEAFVAVVLRHFGDIALGDHQRQLLFVFHQLIPVDPVFDERMIDQIVTVAIFFVYDTVDQIEIECRFGTRPNRYPQIRHTGRVGHTRIHNDEFGAFASRIGDKACGLLEIVPGVRRMRRLQEDQLRVRPVRRVSVVVCPLKRTFARTRRTDVRMRIVSVTSQRVRDTVTESVFVGTSDVIHKELARHLVARFERIVDLFPDRRHRFVPCRTDPFPFAAF